MATLLIRQLDDTTRARLQRRAKAHGRSVEAEARELLKTAVLEKPLAPASLGEAIHRRFAKLGGVELTIPARGPIRKPPQ